LKHLDEDSIKKAGIRFLKEYYKYRPRTGHTVTSLDQKTDDGIITDGMFSFVSEEGTPFLATLEATSFDSKNEVLYRRQEVLLNWDSAVYTAFLVVAFFTFSHYYDWVTINKDGWLMSIFCLLCVAMGGFFIFKSIIGGLQRYRYIYAIEQFKKYHADEQWIAIADDVFEENTDSYLKELKTQCVRNGFGLISVNKEEVGRHLITPSREEVFGKARANKHFHNRDQYAQYSKTEKVRGYWNKVVSKLIGKRSQNSTSRYQRSFTSQILLCLVALLILSGIFYKESLESPIAFVNEKKYEKELTEKAKEIKPETSDFVIDSAHVDHVGNKVKPYLEEVSQDVVDEDDEQSWNAEIEKYFDDPGERHSEIYISSEEGKFVSYDCERFLNYTGTKYLIQEGVYTNINEVRKQLIRLKNKGINANCLWTGCFNDQVTEFIIFIDFLFDDKKEAGLISKNLQRRFQLEKGYLKIRSLTV
jgi:hypothetical protein